MRPEFKLEMGGLFETAINDFLAVQLPPCFSETINSSDQYSLNGSDVTHSPNVEYSNIWNPTDGWKVASHHFRATSAPYLRRIGKTWDLLAISSVLRDGHFLVAIKAILQD